MSAGKELWRAILQALRSDAGLMAMVDGIHDKAPTNPWGTRQAYISRGPFYGAPEDAECIPGQEITAQIDIWSRGASRWIMDDIIGKVRKALHDRDLPLDEAALATIQVRLTRNTDDPDPNTQHGVVQIVATIEEAVDP